jgi:hypothetical protein
MNWFDERGVTPGPSKNLLVLYTTAMALHFPVDMILTLSAWSFETNPVVVALGPERWVFIKLLVFVAATAVVVDSTRYNPRPYTKTASVWLTGLIALGLLFVVPNIVILGGLI